MRLIVQPDHGLKALLQGIVKAKKSIEVMIFRFDRPELEQALIEAVERGVFVHALIAFTNRGGEQWLRKLEMRFLASGITVARTADDLIRYHGKMMVIDRQELYLLGFNFTYLDIHRSRSFGLTTCNRDLVGEAARLFEADCKRQNYSAKCRNFLVSPVNARGELTSFIQGARKELLIYDPKISDPALLDLLRQRQDVGVAVQIIGSVSKERLPALKLKGLRLHTRTMIRDRTEAFLGSQSLRRVELDRRREIGIIFRNEAVVRQMVDTFAKDWQASSLESLNVKLASPREPPRKSPIGVIESLVRRMPFPSLAKQVQKLVPKRGRRDKRKIRGGLSKLVTNVVGTSGSQSSVERKREA